MELTIAGVSGIIIAFLGYLLKQKDNALSASILTNKKDLDQHKLDCTERNEKHARLEERLEQFMAAFDRSQQGIDAKFESIADRLLDISERLPDKLRDDEFRTDFKEFKKDTNEAVKLNSKRIDSINSVVVEMQMNRR